jgi:hypothetical protein
MIPATQPHPDRAALQQAQISAAVYRHREVRMTQDTADLLDVSVIVAPGVERVSKFIDGRWYVCYRWRA